jgi:two-component system, NtrC family, sensor kinase
MITRTSCPPSSSTSCPASCPTPCLDAADTSTAGDAKSVAAGVRVRVLLPLAGALLVLLAVVVALFVRETDRRQAEDLARTTVSVEALFREQSAAGVAAVRSIIEQVLDDRRLAAALRAHDRQALLALTKPTFETIRARNQITHFYFILPDRTMLLRVQAPDKWGDRIDRFVLQEAQRTGKPFWGNEQGPLGSFTLRVTYPWFDDGELIGYLEMGIEFEDIMATIKQYLDVDIFVAIEKRYFDRAKWDEAQQKRAQPVPWDEFPEVVVLSRTTPAIPAPIRSYLAELPPRHEKRAFEVGWGERVAQTVVVPFANLRGQTLGEMIVLRDITAATAERRQAIAGVAAIVAAIGGALMIFFHVLLGRVQRDVAERTARCADAQRRVVAEQLERQHTEAALARQQERNELLEARARVVEELAAAKEAAEAALSDNVAITGALRAAQAELVATARRAGMAEIATNVLHNVGNVLNSVTVAAGVVSGRVRASKLAGLAKTVKLLDEHAGDLADFVTRDPKGRLIPDYLAKLADALAGEQAELLAEIDQLVRRIDHIRDIIATQQSYAGAVCVVEPVGVESLIDDALCMEGDALERAGVAVHRDVVDLPPLPLDRHRVLQILVNLVSNARHALAGVSGRPRRLMLRAALADGRLRIEVADDGVGIPAENLAKIFGHAFTTRPDGHGFGLHGAALAALEMGGTLAAASDGPGKGATFTLELPLPPTEAPQ